ncbi:MAG: electron transport complex subunit RsxC [Defluviitaleaceae bacterium]|nr:electron transport complex subunit RsxC [Defluviitaleaceae bacterium]MCL2837035.1 electron transport complex subunit RsxC [Defluviitaleaceae bacterium]
MKTRTFRRGGVYPPDCKHYTDKKSIEAVFPAEGEHMRYALSQHIGEACVPVVRTGERVLAGQKIADSKAAVSAPVHASVSGIVRGFTDTLVPSGNTVTAIVVENDGLCENHPGVLPENIQDESIARLKPEYIISAIREAGIVGLGGAGFPTHIKLSPPKDRVIEYIIVNACECEPYLTGDHRIMLEERECAITGLKIIMRLFPAAKGIIAVGSNKMNAVNMLGNACAGERGIEVAALASRYPQGSEKQLIQACTRRNVPDGGLPSDIGCIVINISTVVSVERAVRRREPLTRRVITVAGGAIARPGNYEAPIGLSFDALVEAAGGFRKSPVKFIFGGPMTGVSLHNIDIPVTKTSAGLLCLTQKEAYIPPEKNCIRCGKCAARCPMGLFPYDLNKYAIAADDGMFAEINGAACIGCGSCTYICPAKRHLTQSIRDAQKRVVLRAGRPRSQRGGDTEYGG